jgi:hypothetical protein
MPRAMAAALAALVAAALLAIIVRTPLASLAAAPLPAAAPAATTTASAAPARSKPGVCHAIGRPDDGGAPTLRVNSRLACGLGPVCFPAAEPADALVVVDALPRCVESYGAAARGD